MSIEARIVDETTIPVLMIGDDWSIDEIETLQDCDDAFLVLTERVAQLETDAHKAHSYFIDTCKRAPWHDRAIAGLKMTKATLAILQNKRANIARREKQLAQDTRDRKLLDHIKATETEAFKRALSSFIG
jgi:hypothetical protein